MKILLLGKNGQVGWELQRSLSLLGEVIALDRIQADFTHPDSLRAQIQEIKPEVIVNAVAYTAVDKAESDSATAELVNVESVQVLAEEAHKLNAWLVHYSTDYVFDGSKKTPYNEEDETNPLSVYGKTKRDGELVIQQNHDKYLIFRTSWVFGAHGKNFAKTILRLAAEKTSLNIVSDQIGAPTSAAYIADATALALYKILQKNDLSYSGIYHLVSGGKASWFDFAKYVVTNTTRSGLTLPVNSINPITTTEYPTPATRPLNSCLDASKFTRTFGINQPDWKWHVRLFLENMDQ